MQASNAQTGYKDTVRVGAWAGEQPAKVRVPHLQNEAQATVSLSRGAVAVPLKQRIHLLHRLHTHARTHIAQHTHTHAHCPRTPRPRLLPAHPDVHPDVSAPADTRTSAAAHTRTLTVLIDTGSLHSRNSVQVSIMLEVSCPANSIVFSSSDTCLVSLVGDVSSASGWERARGGGGG
jgi:hypothetical protein